MRSEVEERVNDSSILRCPPRDNALTRREDFGSSVPDWCRLPGGSQLAVAMH
jgi:hypothetical protein